MVQHSDGELRIEPGLQAPSDSGRPSRPRPRPPLGMPTEHEAVRFAGAAAVTTAAVYVAMVALTTQVASIRAGSAWQSDPYDAIASIGGQVVAAVGIITLVRLLRYPGASGMSLRAMQFVLRGGWVILTVAIVNLAADVIAWAGSAAGRLPRGAATASEVALLVTGAVALAATYWMALGQAAAWTRRARAGAAAAEAEDPAGDLFGDAAVLVRRVLAWSSSISPAMGRIAARAWDVMLHACARLRFIGPRRHPWRFATAVGLAAGIWLAAAHAAEASSAGRGEPFSTTILVWAVFVVIETTAVLVGFWALRRFLGLALPEHGRGRPGGAA